MKKYRGDIIEESLSDKSVLKEVKIISGWINQAIINHADEKVLAKLHKEVTKLCKRFPLPA